VATEAMLRWTRIYRTEAAFAEMGCEERRHARQVLGRPLWEEFEVWLKLQRTQVPDGTKIAEAIDYSLNAWKALTVHLDDGAVPIDNNLIERQIKPWKLGANNANRSLMRSRASWPSGPGRKSRPVTSRRGTGLHIKNGISCGGNPTSGDRHGCVRFHSPGAGSMAARQRPGTVRAGLLAPLGRAALLPRNGAHVSLLRRTLRTVVATAPA
jgi:hypothetical protein